MTKEEAYLMVRMMSAIVDEGILHHVAVREPDVTEPVDLCTQCGHPRDPHMGERGERGCYTCWDSPGNVGWNHPFKPPAEQPDDAVQAVADNRLMEQAVSLSWDRMDGTQRENLAGWTTPADDQS